MTVQELYQSIGGSYESAKRILPSDNLIGKFVVRFLNDQSFGKLEAAAAQGDAAGIFEGAHALKGVCGNLGLDQLSQAASELADAYRPGKESPMDPDTLAEKVGSLKALYDKTMAGIQAFSQQ